MKKLLFAISTLSAMMAVSCSKTDVVAENATEPEFYEVKIGMSGAITSEIGPLTKALAENEFIGIDVWACPNDGNSTTYTPYAYGLFTTDDIVVKLLNGYKYKFTARKGNSIAFFWKHIGNQNTNWTSSVSLNTFHFSADTTFATQCPLVNVIGDYYYGQTTDYLPSKDGSVSIDMMKVSFGLTIIVNNLEEGASVYVAGPDITIAYPSTQYSSLYAIKDYVNSVTNADFYEEITITVTLTDKNGATSPLGSTKIKVMRNKLTKVTIDATAPTTNNGFSLSYSTDEMTDASEDYSIGGESTNTPIN